MARDKIGNKLTVGDLVMVKLKEPHTIAEIVECVDVQLDTLRGKQPKHIKINIDITINDMSGNGVYDLVKICVPPKIPEGEA